MIKRVPLLDATTGQQFQLTGETTDIVPCNRTVYMTSRATRSTPRNARSPSTSYRKAV